MYKILLCYAQTSTRREETREKEYVHHIHRKRLRERQSITVQNEERRLMARRINDEDGRKKKERRKKKEEEERRNRFILTKTKTKEKQKK